MTTLRFSLLALAGIILAGCASVSVTAIRTSPMFKPQSLPAAIYVAQFETQGANFRVDRTGTELEEIQNNLRAVLQGDLVQRLHEHVAPTQPLFTGMTPNKGWLVRGRFLRVEQGSRALRLVIGMGAGGTKVETEVEVVDLETGLPFLRFKTTGGSNAEPGALSGVIATGPIDLAVGVVAGAAGQLTRGLTEDLGRTAHESTAQISEFCSEQGWIDSKRSLHSKKLFEERPDVIRNHTR